MLADDKILEALNDVQRLLLGLRETLQHATLKYNDSDELLWREQVLGTLQQMAERLPLHAAAVQSPDSIAIISAVNQRIDERMRPAGTASVWEFLTEMASKIETMDVVHKKLDVLIHHLVPGQE
jgi:hypothetical protein